MSMGRQGRYRIEVTERSPPRLCFHIGLGCYRHTLRRQRGGLGFVCPLQVVQSGKSRGKQSLRKFPTGSWGRGFLTCKQSREPRRCPQCHQRKLGLGTLFRGITRLDDFREDAAILRSEAERQPEMTLIGKAQPAPGTPGPSLGGLYAWQSQTPEAVA